MAVVIAVGGGLELASRGRGKGRLGIGEQHRGHHPVGLLLAQTPGGVVVAVPIDGWVAVDSHVQR